MGTWPHHQGREIVREHQGTEIVREHFPMFVGWPGDKCEARCVGVEGEGVWLRVRGGV